MTTATSNITTAQSSLVFAGLADLNTAKGVVTALTEEDYTVASWTDLDTASSLPETTNDEVVTKTTAINNAVTHLITVAASEALTTIKATVTALTEADYTVASWADIDTAMLLPETTNDEVVAKTTAITTGIGNLEFAGLADLNAAKAIVVLGLTEENYTVASWADIDTAMLLPETTNDEIVAKTTAINDAVTHLINVLASEALTTIKATASGLTEEDYTVAS